MLARTELPRPPGSNEGMLRLPRHAQHHGNQGKALAEGVGERPRGHTHHGLPCHGSVHGTQCSTETTTVDYREDGLLVVTKTFSVCLGTSFVPLDGDGFAFWLTKQDEVKAGTVTPAMQQKYATEIRAAKLEEFKSYLDNDAIRLTDCRKLGRDVNFLTSALGLLRFPGQVCLGPADRQPYRYWDLFHLDLKTAFLQGEHYNLSSRSVVGYCSVLQHRNKVLVDCAWRPVTDGKLLGSLGSVACKKRGWFPYENVHLAAPR